MYEAHTNQGAWLSHPRRMLRHKAMIQCARICFGLSGVYDPDEALRITSRNSLANTTIQSKGSEHAGPSLNDSSQRKAEQNLGARFVKNWVKKHPGVLQSSLN
jgi:hypothetical protein